MLKHQEREKVSGLEKEKFAAVLSKFSESKHLLDFLLFFLVVFSISFSLSFFDFLSSLFIAFLLGAVAYFFPFYCAILVMIFSLLAFSYFNPYLGWAYFLLIGAIAYFEFLSNWRLILIGHLVVLAPFAFGYFGGFLSIFVLSLASFYFGSKKSLFLSSISFLFYLLLFSLLPSQNIFGFGFKNTFSSQFQTHSPLSLSNFFRGFGQIVFSFLNIEVFLKLFSFLLGLSDKLISILFFDAGIFYLIFWTMGFFLSPKFYKFIFVRKKDFKLLHGVSSLTLFLLFVSEIFASAFFNIQPSNFYLIVYIVISIFLFFLLDFFDIHICHEVEIQALTKQKSFGKFGLSNLAEVEGGPKSLDDVGGYDLLKQELLEAIAIPLTRPELSKAYSLSPLKGILLFGPPGTGKTLIISALAKELNIGFYYVKCSDILSSWYGESERNISELFETARKNAPCILFFDEIDAIAKSRDLFFADDVGPRVLSVLLSEMDGIKSSSSKSVIIIGATNNPDRLDKAILRPGRLDKIIYMPLPDLKAREQILSVHTKGLKLAKDVDLLEIAKLTTNYSGADLANLVAEAKRLAIREARAKNIVVPISQKHFLSLLHFLKPSVSEEQIQMYKNFEEKFKRSIS